MEIDCGKKTKIHQHHEHETFIVTQGRGVFFSDNQEIVVETGDVIYINPFKDHFFQASTASKLHLLSIWWESNNYRQENNAVKNIIFTPPPTPNGSLHLGHISGPYISADVIKRYLQSCNKSVDLIVGTDKNQSYVELKAKQTKENPQNIYSTFTDSIFETFDKASVSHDYIHDCNADFHKEFAKKFIQLMFSKGLIQVEVSDALMCSSCDDEIFDAFVVGNCPTCGAKSNGCVCEDCGSPNNGHDLLNSRCNVCDTPSSKVQQPKGVLDLAKCRSYSDTAMSQINATGKLQEYLNRQNGKQHMDGYVVTYTSKWGMPSDQSALTGQVNLCWIEMAAAYIASIYKCLFQDESTDVEAVIEKLNSAKFNVIHLMGFDNSFYYAYLYPQIFAAVGIKNLKITFVVNEFLLLEQSKFSTSRNHAIWANDVFSSPDVTDWYRFYLSVKKPENSRENYDPSEFIAFKDETNQQLRSLFELNSTRLKTYFNSTVPTYDALTPEQAEYSEYFLSQQVYICSCLSTQENYSVKKYAVAVKELIEKITRYQQKTAFYFNEAPDIEHLKANMVIECKIISILRTHLSCLMPSLIETFPIQN